MADYASIMDQLLDESNDDLIELTPDGGEKAEFEQIGLAVYDGNFYAILHPVKLAEGQVVVFKLEQDDEDNLTLVTDEKLAQAILRSYMEDVQKELEEDNGEDYADEEE